MFTQTQQRTSMRDSLPTRSAGAGKPRGRKKNKFLPYLIILLGSIVLMYPVFSTQWNNYQQREAAAEYSQLTQKEDPTVLARAIEEAHEYNQNKIVRQILDPWQGSDPSNDADYKAYLKQLSLTSAMARIVIPKIQVDLPVFHGTRPDTLEKGVGHLYGTDLPVGGVGTHAVLTSHTGLQTATLFDNLKDLTKGDSIYIETYGQKLRYVVYGTEVVLPEEADSLHPVNGKDLITLITCTPYGINSHRLLVHAERAPLDEAGVSAIKDGIGWGIQWWMYVFAAMILACLPLAIWLSSKKTVKKFPPAHQRYVKS